MDNNLGKQGILWSVFGGELVNVAYELRFMIIFTFVLILSDLWWGHSETMLRYSQAEKAGDKAGMEKYKWHKSRAIRRTANKFVDYSTYWLLGAFMGLAITEPMDWCNHLYTAAGALGVGCLAEIASIVGHVAYVKFGIEIKVKDVWRWLGRLIVNILKFKSKDFGNAVEQTINQNENANK